MSINFVTSNLLILNKINLELKDFIKQHIYGLLSCFHAILIVFVHESFIQNIPTHHFLKLGLTLIMTFILFLIQLQFFPNKEVLWILSRIGGAITEKMEKVSGES